MYRISFRQKGGDQSVTGLMKGCIALILFADNHALPFNAHQNLIFGFFQIAHVHTILRFSGGHQGGFIDQIGQVCPGKTRG